MQQSRLDKAKLIIDRPGDFKVCEACGSIVSLTTQCVPTATPTVLTPIRNMSWNKLYCLHPGNNVPLHRKIWKFRKRSRAVFPMLSSAAQATAPCYGKNGRAAVERELFFLIHQTGGVLLLAQIRNAEDGGLNQVGRA